MNLSFQAQYFLITLLIVENIPARALEALCLDHSLSIDRTFYAVSVHGLAYLAIYPKAGLGVDIVFVIRFALSTNGLAFKLIEFTVDAIENPIAVIAEMLGRRNLI